MFRDFLRWLFYRRVPDAAPAVDPPQEPSDKDELKDALAKIQYLSTMLAVKTEEVRSLEARARVLGIEVHNAKEYVRLVEMLSFGEVARLKRQNAELYRAFRNKMDTKVQLKAQIDSLELFLEVKALTEENTLLRSTLLELQHPEVG